jgi:hypothetical protein
MRPPRWKTRYATGEPTLDEQNRILFGLVEELGAELGRREHCQDMNELYRELLGLVQDQLERDPAGLARNGAPGRTEVETILRGRLPLAALSTPACRECGLCDLLMDRARAWLR